jgi:hypothetical protein
LHNATGCAVNVDFPARATFVKVGDPRVRCEGVPLRFNVAVHPPAADSDARGDEVGCSTVPAHGTLAVTVEVPTVDGDAKDWTAGDRWTAEATIVTNAAHDLGLVLEIPPP